MASWTLSDTFVRAAVAAGYLWHRRRQPGAAELHRAVEGRQADLPVTASYTQLMRSMWSPDAASTGLCDTSVLQDFKRTIGKFNEQFAGYNQQDVSEFLAFLIDGLHEEMNGIRVKPWVEMDTDGKPLPELAQCAWDYYLSRERSVITDAFNGQMMSTLTPPLANRWVLLQLGRVPRRVPQQAPLPSHHCQHHRFAAFHPSGLHQPLEFPSRLLLPVPLR